MDEGLCTRSHRGGFLEPVLARVAEHALLERGGQTHRIAREADREVLDHRPVALIVLFAAGAQGDAELGRGARTVAHRTAPAADAGRASADRHGPPDGLHDLIRLTPGREGPDLDPGGRIGERALPADRQPREAFVGEPNPHRRRRTLAPSVEPRLMLFDQPLLQHLGFECGRTDPVLDALGLPQHLGDLPTALAREVGAHAGSQVGRLADIEHPTVPVDELVDPRLAGQARRQVELLRLRMSGDGREREQVVESAHTPRRRPFDQDVEQVHRRERIVERPMGRGVGKPEPLRQLAEPEPRHLVGQEPTGEGERVETGVAEHRVAPAASGRIEEREVEPYVVADQHGAGDELGE